MQPDHHRAPAQHAGRPRSVAEALVRACTALVIGVALVSLTGWAAGEPKLTGALPGLPAMKVNTALALIALAVATFLLRPGASVRAARGGTALGAVVALYGVLVAGEYVFGATGIDTLLAADGGAKYPGRPALLTALAFTALGTAAATTRGRPRIAAAFLAAAMVVVLFAIIGYVYGVAGLRANDRSGIAVPTLLCLVALLYAMLTLPPGRRLLSPVHGDDAGARMARVLLLATVGFALLFGGLGYWVEVHLDVDLALADAIYTIADVLVLGAVVLVTARSLRAYDRDVHRLAAIVETAQDGIITNRLDGTITSWNAAAERIYGYTEREMIGSLMSVLAPPDRAGESAAVFARVAAGEAVSLETKRVARDGRVLDVSLTVSPMRDATGAVVDASTIVRDITAEKRAEADMRRMAAVVGSSADAIISIDPEGRFTSWNPGAEQLLGYRAEEILGRPVTMIVPEERQTEFTELMSRLESGSAIAGWETQRRSRSGRLVDVEMTISPLADVHGEFTGATAIMRDIRERKEAGRRFAAALEAAPDGMMIVDEHGVIEQVNARIEEIFGFARQELVGRPVEVLVPAAARPGHAALREHYVEEPKARMLRSGSELTGATKDGGEVPIEVSLSPLRTEDGLRIIAAVRDVTERHRAQRELAASEELFRRSFEDSGIGMALVGLSQRGLGHVLEVNEALATITGYTPADLREMEPLGMVHPDDVGTLAGDFAKLLSGELAVIRREPRMINATGDVLWTAVSVSLVRDGDGAPLHAVIQVQDVSERKRFEGQLQHLADHDALTGLFNRRRFEQELVREISSSRRYATSGAVLVLDLDHFKLVNDTLGHAAGDELITITGEILRRRLRESDVLGRMGGDEFAVILSHVDAEQAFTIGELLLRELREDTRASSASGSRRVTASIGVAPFGPGCEAFDAEDLLAQADIAMYDAKEAGRDRVATYDVGGARHARMQTRLAWTHRIEIALEEEQFVIHAQPIRPVGRDDGRRRYELLLRMVGEGGDLIPPGTFLYVAERSDLARRIDRWVVGKAVEMLADQQRRGHDVTFSVNLSGKSVTDPEMLADIVELVTGAGIEPGRLTFEITETAAIVNVARATEFAQQLREIGCGFALDDFGAGFASFYYLKHLSFDYLKIDGEFIKDLPASATNQLVVQSVVDIARGMGKQTIAEYVGDEQTMELLRQYGVDFGQGYFLGRPEPLERVLSRV